MASCVHGKTKGGAAREKFTQALIRHCNANGIGILPTRGMPCGGVSSAESLGKAMGAGAQVRLEEVIRHVCGKNRKRMEDNSS